MMELQQYDVQQGRRSGKQVTESWSGNPEDSSLIQGSNTLVIILKKHLNKRINKIILVLYKFIRCL